MPALDPPSTPPAEGSGLPVPVGESRWRFPPPRRLSGDLQMRGGDLDPATIIAAYRAGYFPMPLPDDAAHDGVVPLGWFHPRRRAVMAAADCHEVSGVRRARARLEVRLDHDPEQVLDVCADPARPGAWIDTRIRRAYLELFELGWMHTVECWTETGTFAGGLYGVEIGGVFSGESMVTVPGAASRDASKLALVELATRLADTGVARVIEAQWLTEHLARFGFRAVPRSQYLALIDAAHRLPPACGVWPAASR